MTEQPEVMILDAPGLNGNGGACHIRFAAYVEAGGPIWHPKNPSADHLARVRVAVTAADNAVALHKG